MLRSAVHLLIAAALALPALAAPALSHAADMGDREVSRRVSLGGSCQHCQLQGKKFVGASLTGADFSGSDLKGADLRGASVMASSFNDCDFTDADLRGATAVGSRFDRARFGSALMSGFDGKALRLVAAQMADAKLQSASLMFSDLSDAQLPGAVLVGADLKVSNLTGADGRGADFTSASLVGARLIHGTVPASPPRLAPAPTLMSKCLLGVRPSVRPALFVSSLVSASRCHCASAVSDQCANCRPSTADASRSGPPAACVAIEPSNCCRRGKRAVLAESSTARARATLSP